MKAIGYTFGLLLILLSSTAVSQPLGLRSSRTELQYIETDTVRIVYAQGQYDQARRVADVVHEMAIRYPINGGRPAEKISILLQNETDIPNGYVGLAPWRSEFYTSPPSDNFSLGSLPWTELLAIHEYRHVQQRSASKRGLTAAAYYVFGEAFFSAVGNISWPNWYVEGDAVIAETVLTQQGRGRLPAFLNGYREKVSTDQPWKYSKARNGSLRDFVPNHYNLGFLLQNYGRLKYGQDFWDKVALESADYKGLIYPFSKAIKRATGLSSKAFYAEAMAHYADIWKSEETDQGEPLIEPRDARYEQHAFPTVGNNDQVYFYRESFDHVPEICRIDAGQVVKITRPGYMIDPVFSVGGGKIAWSEYRLNSRWEREDYATIVVYDEGTKNKRRLTSKESYFAPALSSDGSRIAAVYDDDTQHWRLRIVDTDNGEVLTELPNPENYYYSYPVWTSDEQALVMSLRNHLGQMCLGTQAIDNGELILLTEWTYDPLGRPSLDETDIYVSMSTGGIDRICKVDLNDGGVTAVSGSNVSSYSPVISPDGALYFIEFSLSGNKLKTLGSTVDIAFERRSSMEQGKPYLEVSEDEGNILNLAVERDYEESRYGLFRQPVYLHSWRPILDDPIYQFEFQSLNVLQSLRWNTGFQWNANSNDIGPYTEITLGMWYPEIVLGYSGWTRDFTRPADSEKFNWFEHTVSGGVRIPFKGFHGPFNYSGAFSTRINRLMAVGDVEYNLNFVSHGFNMVHRLRQSRKHPITRLGQAIDISFPYSIDADTASQFQVKTDFTFPSPFKNQVLWLQFDYRRELESNSYRFGDNFNYARGYEPIRTDEIYRLGCNYQLPLVYPDFGFAGIFYVKRVRANVFYDHSWVDESTKFRSTGAELIFDIDVLNVEPFTFGLRWAHLLDEDPLSPGQRNVFSIFIPTNRI